MQSDSFAVFILTHGRAKNVLTVRALQNSGYTGKTYIIIDDEDEQEPEYRQLFGDAVIKFCKKEAAKQTDVMTPSKKKKRRRFCKK